MARTLRAAALAAAATVAVVLTAVPAQAAGAAATARGAGPAIAVRDSRLDLTPPLTTHPLDDQCAVGGRNHPYCGLGALQVTLAGFDAFGGIPACADPGDCAAEPALATFVAGRARVDVLVRCTGEWFPRVRSVPVSVQGGFGPSDVSPASRIDSDAVRLVLFIPLPSPAEIGACGPGATTLAAEVVRSVSLDFAGATDGFPSWTTRVPGAWRVPLPR